MPSLKEENLLNNECAARSPLLVGCLIYTSIRWRGVIVGYVLIEF